MSSKEKSKEGAAMKPSAMKPAFPDLRKQHGSIERLEEHLNQLDSSALKALILNGAFPEAKSSLRHCVYCHKTYNAADNDVRENCDVEHFLDIETTDEGDRTECCGKTMDNDDWSEGMSRAEDEEPYCYSGRHWEREITTDDEENEESEYTFDDLGMLDDKGEFLPKTWWRQWRKSGPTCEKMKCAGRATRTK